MNTQPFKHGLDSTKLEGIYACNALLADLNQHIKTVTEYKPEKRYIDSVELLDRVQATADEFIALLNEAQKRLQKA